MLDQLPFVALGVIASLAVLVVGSAAHRTAISTRSRRRTLRRLDEIRRLRP
jgi:hypothetical protein